MGVTLFTSYNSNAAYDPAGIDLTAIPKFERYTINPKLFFNLTEKTTLMLGLNTGIEKRIGGDLHYIAGKGDSIHSYFERNNTQRISTQFNLEHKFGKCSHLTLKNSYNSFNKLQDMNLMVRKMQPSQSSIMPIMAKKQNGLQA